MINKSETPSLTSQDLIGTWCAEIRDKTIDIADQLVDMCEPLQRVNLEGVDCYHNALRIRKNIEAFPKNFDEYIEFVNSIDKE